MTQAMKTSIKKDESAGLAEQILPGSQPITVPPLPKIAGEVLRSQPVEISAEELATRVKLSLTPVRAKAAESKTAETPALTPMARISEIISREIRMFRRAADDLVEVVLTPDAKTQISLRLQWREGQVEAQARCDFGDYRSLNLQWPQLQATLASQGVRLAHLSERPQTGFTDFFNHPNFAQSQRGRHHPAEGQSSLDRSLSSPIKRPAKTPAVRKINRANPLLESWT
jgi:hypothetical protein